MGGLSCLAPRGKSDARERKKKTPHPLSASARRSASTKDTAGSNPKPSASSSKRFPDLTAHSEWRNLDDEPPLSPAMPTLLEEVRRADATAAEQLKRAGFLKDSEIRRLDRQDLHELFPGVRELKRRKDVFDIIHKRRPVAELLSEVKQFIPNDALRTALTNNGVLVEYLGMMKDMKTQVDNVQSFLAAHIALLEDIQRDGNQAHPEPHRGLMQGENSGGARMVSGYGGPTGAQQGAQGLMQGENSGGARMVSGYGGPTGAQQGAQGVAAVATLKYQVIVSGKTFRAHEQLLTKVKTPLHDVKFIESNQDSQINVLFCPITSRVGSDVDAALSDVKDDKPVILVLMYHTHTVKHVSSMRTWDRKDVNVVLHVNVFYHDTKQGLLICDENNRAVSQIQEEMLKHRVPKISAGPTCSSNENFVHLDKDFYMS